MGPLRCTFFTWDLRIRSCPVQEVGLFGPMRLTADWWHEGIR